MSAFAELAVTTNFSFLRGASHPQEMVARADDEAKKRKIKLVVGTRLVTIDGLEVLAYPTDRAAYGRLCRLITAGNLKAKKSECHLTFEEILNAAEGQIFIALSPVSLFSDSAAVDPQKITSPWRGEVVARSATGGGDAAFRPHTPPRPLRDRPSPSRGGFEAFTERLSALADVAPGRTFLAGVHYHRGDEPRRLG